MVPGARVNGGKILAQKNYSGRFGVTYAVDKSTLAFRQTDDAEHFSMGDSFFGSENSNFKDLAKQIFGSRGSKRASSGHSGG